jgi:hypothetical protein
MDLKASLFEKAFAQVAQKPFLHSLYDSNAAWLRETGVPEEFIEFLNQYAYASFVK